MMARFSLVVVQVNVAEQTLLIHVLAVELTVVMQAELHQVTEDVFLFLMVILTPMSVSPSLSGGFSLLITSVAYCFHYHFKSRYSCCLILFSRTFSPRYAGNLEVKGAGMFVAPAVCSTAIQKVWQLLLSPIFPSGFPSTSC